MSRRAEIVLSLALAAALLALPGSAQMNKAAGVGGTINSVEGAPTLLYDQNNNASGNGAPDQDFEAAFNAYDSRGADDFEVTFAGGWVVEQVTTVGTTGGATTSVDVQFLADAAGFPDAAPVTGCDYPGIVPTSQVGGSFVLDLPTGCNLTTGFYWVAIQANQDFGTAGQHFWSNRTVQSNQGAVWENPGDGFATGCTTWDRMTTCGVGGGASPDFLFQILGTEGIPGGGPGEPIVTIPTLDVVGLVALFALLAGAAFFMLRRRQNA